MKKTKKKVGKVTEEERDDIQTLFERKKGLKELTHSLVDLDKKELENNAYVLAAPCSQSIFAHILNFTSGYDHLTFAGTIDACDHI